jgi:hypothetical protein
MTNEQRRWQDPAKFAPPAVALPPFDPLVAADGP